MIGNMEIVHNLRNIENKDWATITFIIAFALIVIAKTLFTQRFFIFLDLFFSDKYLKLYNKKENITSTFNVILYIVQIITLSFFIIILFENFHICKRNDSVYFIKIMTSIFFISCSKYLIEKMVSIILEIEEISSVFNHFKMSYRSYIFIFLFPLIVVLYYNNFNIYFLLSIGFFIIIYNSITYINILKYFKEQLFSNLFYFILYLCTLEIAPFYIMYYWIKK